MADGMYYYGQGRVYLARYGSSEGYRFVGDVSALTLSLRAERKGAKGSYGGRLATRASHIVEHTGSVSATWFDFNAENLATVLHGTALEINPARVRDELLPGAIRPGLRYPLQHQGVWGVAIEGLDENVDYIVDESYGVIEFFSEHPTSLSVEYWYAGGTTTSVFTDDKQIFSLRYEGMNLVEDNCPILLELYKLEFDPVSEIALINNDVELASLGINATLMLDLLKPADNHLGRFGHITNITQLGVRYGGTINYDGHYNYRGMRN